MNDGVIEINFDNVKNQGIKHSLYGLLAYAKLLKIYIQHITIFSQDMNTLPRVNAEIACFQSDSKVYEMILKFLRETTAPTDIERNEINKVIELAEIGMNARQYITIVNDGDKIKKGDTKILPVKNKIITRN